MGNQELELDELKELDEQIRYHADLFFNKNISEISDSEYDDMVNRFNELAALYPDVAEGLETTGKLVPITLDQSELKVVKFDTPMLGLKKVYTKPEVTDFVKTIKGGVVYEYKMDGLALELQYDQGKLVSAFTRGDSLEGEDVTHAIALFKPDQIPLTVYRKDRFDVRGEGYITLSDFEYYNKVSPVPAKTMRNAVSGWVRASKSNQNPLVKGLLCFGGYWASSNFGLNTYTEVIDELRTMGFGVCPRIDVNHITNDIRAEDIPVDGVVVKADLIDEHSKLGYATKVLNWAIAYKFPGITARTKLLTAVWQVGGSGAVTPVAVYAPVNILGTDNTRATLHSLKEFKDLGLTEGCDILVVRSGDCIPHIQKAYSDTGGKLLKPPRFCPACDALLVVDNATLMCPNTSDCPGQLVQRCVNLADKKGFDIVGLSVLKLTKLVDAGYIKQTSDIFEVPSSMYDAMVNRSLQDLKQVPLNKFLKGLSLPGVGEQTAKRIAVAMGESTSNILGLLTDIKFLLTIEGIGTGVALDINNAVVDPKFIVNFNNLMRHVTPIPLITTEVTHKICVSGKVGISRTELTNYFAEQGIEVSKSVTKDCHLVVLGDAFSPAKEAKAIKLSIPVVSMDSFDSLVALSTYIQGLS